MVRVDTSQRILDTAERLVQTRGFNGFSYADIATTLGVTKASLHYHFPAKAKLGQRLIERYEKNFLAALEESTRPVRRRARNSSATPRSMRTCSATTACACAGCWPPSTRRCRSR